MPGNRFWEEIEKDDLFNAAAGGLTREQLIAAHRAKYPYRTEGAVRGQLDLHDAVLPPSDGIEKRPHRQSFMEQDAAFCCKLQAQLDAGKETGGLKLVNGKWSRAYAAVQQRGRNDGSL